MAEYIAYLTYDEYKEFGGQQSESAFSIYQRRAQRILDGRTYNRIDPENITSAIKEVLTIIIDILYKDETSGEEVKSFSNGVVSYSFDNSNKKSVEQNINELIDLYLPVELISGVVS